MWEILLTDNFYVPLKNESVLLVLAQYLILDLHRMSGDSILRTWPQEELQ